MQIGDGYLPFFVQLYFCIIVIIGHYYMLQFLLAVIMQNLSKIMIQEAIQDIEQKREAVIKDKLEIKRETLSLMPKIIEQKQVEEEIKEQVTNPVRMLESGGSNKQGALSTNTQWNFKSQENFATNLLQTEDKNHLYGDENKTQLSAPNSNRRSNRGSDVQALMGEMKTEADLPQKPVLVIPQLNKNVVKPLNLPLNKSSPEI